MRGVFVGHNAWYKRGVWRDALYAVCVAICVRQNRLGAVGVEREQARVVLVDPRVDPRKVVDVQLDVLRRTELTNYENI